jgi:hypothetical protein
MRRLMSVVVLVCSIPGASVRADGLVFQMPPDGTWARFDVKTDGEFKPGQSPAQKIAFPGTLTISSVGQVTRNEQKCRWVELKSETKTEGVHPKLTLKMLIPEEHCQRGADPLAHSIRTHFNPKGVDKNAPAVESFIDEGFNRIQYEVERFRGVFPKQLAGAKGLARETVDTPAGKFEDCEVIVGTSDYDGCLLNDGRMVHHAQYKIVLNPKAPFGVVSLNLQGTVREITAKNAVSGKLAQTLTLAAVGNDAVSDLPTGSADKPTTRDRVK